MTYLRYIPPLEGLALSESTCSILIYNNSIDNETRIVCLRENKGWSPLETKTTYTSSARLTR